MNNNLPNIPPSIEEMKLWQKGQFPLGKRHDELQIWFDQDPFLQDALAGLQLDPEFSGFGQKTQKTPSHKSHFKGWILGLVIGLGCAVLAVSIWNPLETSVEKVSSFNSPLSQVDVNQTSESIPTQEEKKSAVQTNPSSVQKLNDEHVSNSNIANETPLRSMDARSGQLSLSRTNGYPLAKVNVCIDVHGYEVYPYKERSEIKTFELTGMPADNGQSQEPNKRVSYLTYLEEAIVAFQEQDLELAQDHCENILHQFPNDINALYLKSKCVFNSSPAQSLRGFEKTLSLNNGRLNEKEIKEFIRLAQ